MTVSLTCRCNMIGRAVLDVTCVFLQAAVARGTYAATTLSQAAVTVMGTSAPLGWRARHPASAHYQVCAAQPLQRHLWPSLCTLMARPSCGAQCATPEALRCANCLRVCSAWQVCLTTVPALAACGGEGERCCNASEADHPCQTRVETDGGPTGFSCSSVTSPPQCIAPSASLTIDVVSDGVAGPVVTGRVTTFPEALLTDSSLRNDLLAGGGGFGLRVSRAGHQDIFVRFEQESDGTFFFGWADDNASSGDQFTAQLEQFSGPTWSEPITLSYRGALSKCTAACSPRTPLFAPTSGGGVTPV